MERFYLHSESAGKGTARTVPTGLSPTFGQFSPRFRTQMSYISIKFTCLIIY